MFLANDTLRDIITYALQDDCRKVVYDDRTETRNLCSHSVVCLDPGVTVLPLLVSCCLRKYRYAPTSAAPMCTMISARFYAFLERSAFGRISGFWSCSR